MKMRLLRQTSPYYTRQNKAAAVTAILLALFTYIHAYAQNNPYKIQNSLYAEYQRLYTIRTSPEVLNGAEKLHLQATLQGDSKAGCIALTLPLQYHHAARSPLATFDKSAERLKGEAMRTGYLQYYFYASAQRVSLLINRQMFLLAIQTAKQHKEDAERLDSDYGRYTFIRCMAKIHQLQDDLPKATEYFIRAYEFAKEKQMNQDMAPLCNYIADTYVERDMPDKAMEWCDRGLGCVANKNNLFGVLSTKLELLFSLGRHDEFLTLYKKYEKDIMQHKNTAKWQTITARRLCCEGKYDEAVKMMQSHGGKETWLKLRYEIAGQQGNHRKAMEYKRKYYEGYARTHIGMSDAHSMSEIDATMETDRLNLEKLRLEYANAAALLKNSEADKRLRQRETDNMRMKYANDSAALVQLKLDSAVAVKQFAANTLKDKTAKTIAKRKQTGEIFMMTAAILLLAAAVVAIVMSRRIMKATKRHNTELSKALAKARQTQKMQDSFINNMSMEVKKPLNDIVGFSRTLLDRQAELGQEEKAAVNDSIGESAEKLAELVNDMLKKALEESTGKASRAIVIAILATLSIIPATANDTHGEVMRLVEEKRTLRALTVAHKAHELAIKAGNWSEAYTTAYDLAYIYKSRTNITRSTEYTEKALDIWRRHKPNVSPAEAMLTLGRQYRQFYQLEKASDMLNEAAPYCITDALRLKLLKESAFISFERDDSASFMAEYALAMKQKAHMTEEDRATIEVEHSFLKKRSIIALEKYQDKLTPRRSLMLRVTMLSHMGKWEQASQVLSEAMQVSRAARASVYADDRKEMESETANKKLEADNARLQLEHARLQLEEQEYSIRMEDRMTEQMRLQAKKDELSRKRISANTADMLAKMTMDKRRIEETNAMNELSDIRTKTAAGIAGIVILLVAVYLITYRRNIKTMRAKNAELDNALKAAEEAEKEKNAFIQSISHEIRTPLNAIMGFSNIMSMQDEELSDDEREKFSTVISNNADLLTEIVYDIIDAAELDSGKKDFSREDICPRQLCDMAITAVRHRIKNDVPLVYSATIKKDFTIKANSRSILQILIHFLTNAIKHTAEGQITIGCDLNEYPGNVCFHVQDTGCGIPEDKREAVFERFFKIDPFQQGTGLGLNICKRIAENINARIMVDPNYNTGARFLLVVPII